MSTIVIQSHRWPLPRPWIEVCINSVRNWALSKGWEYHFKDDALFDYLRPYPYLARYGPVIRSDLARLIWMEACLSAGYDRVIWLDADTLIIEPEALHVPDDDFSVGREVWIDERSPNRFKSYVKVHNAWLHAGQGSVDLPFYSQAALRLLARNVGGVPAQFVGPKLLTALHNIVNFTVNESAGMLSPAVAEDCLRGSQGRRALPLFLEKHGDKMPAALNLSASCETDAMRIEGFYDELVERLLHDEMDLI